MVKFVVMAALSGVLAQGQEPGPSPLPSAPAGPAAPASPTVSAAANARPHSDFSGTWIYNDDESLNAATGKPERNRAVNDRRGVARRPVPAAPSSGGSGMGGYGASNGAGGGRGGGGGGGRIAGGANVPEDIAYNLFIEQRDTLRDLMEIPESLRIEIAQASVNMVDDLDRSLVFPVDGRRQKYQLAAAVFDAKTTWDAGQLKMEIEGPDNLRIFQTWFLNEDGSKLFQIIRIGDPPRARDQKPIGVNRVFDRAK
jgi:hypothetical protein